MRVRFVRAIAPEAHFKRFDSSRKRERDPQDPQRHHMLLFSHKLASGDLAEMRSPQIPKIPITATPCRQMALLPRLPARRDFPLLQFAIDSR
jgi:hypothetical protein